MIENHFHFMVSSAGIINMKDGQKFSMMHSYYTNVVGHNVSNTII